MALAKAERPAEEYRESLAVLHDEAQRLTQIIEDLFTLTRADAGQYPLSPKSFYLDELVADCVHAAAALGDLHVLRIGAAEHHHQLGVARDRRP